MSREDCSYILFSVVILASLTPHFDNFSSDVEKSIFADPLRNLRTHSRSLSIVPACFHAAFILHGRVRSAKAAFGCTQT